MARPKKVGLDYYPMDVDFWDDYKIIDLLNTYGTAGVCVYVAVISEVYKHGYYLEIPKEKLALLIIRLVGSRWIQNKSDVIKIIDFCAEIGLFDKELYEQSVITSRGIQLRYREVTARNKADREKFWLLEPVPEKKTSRKSKNTDADIPEEVSQSSEPEVDDAQTPVNDDFIPQSKVNKSKVNKSKENKNKVNESKVCEGIVIPCRDGEFIVDDTLLAELTHTYPEMDIEKSLKKLCSYISSNPKKQGCKKGVRPYIDMWLSDDNNSGKYRKKQSTYDEIYPAFDIEEYIASGELDELE